MKDFEREDALDILALLVERSTEFDEKTKQRGFVSQQSLADTSDEGKENIKNCFPKSENESENLATKVQDCVQLFRDMSNQYTDDGGKLNHDARMKILDELELSYEYASEMKRAALSASTWLRSVSRSSNDSAKDSNYDRNQPQFRMPSEPPTLKNVALTYREKLEETKNLNLRLNQELSTCRAEIGRLKAMNRNEVSSVCW